MLAFDKLLYFHNTYNYLNCRLWFVQWITTYFFLSQVRGVCRFVHGDVWEMLSIPLVLFIVECAVPRPSQLYRLPMQHPRSASWGCAARALGVRNPNWRTHFRLCVLNYTIWVNRCHLNCALVLHGFSYREVRERSSHVRDWRKPTSYCSWGATAAERRSWICAKRRRSAAQFWQLGDSGEPGKQARRNVRKLLNQVAVGLFLLACKNVGVLICSKS